MGPYIGPMTQTQAVPHSPTTGTASAVVAHCGGCGRFITLQAGGARWLDSSGRTEHVVQASDR
jgi:hypothetical protein